MVLGCYCCFFSVKCEMWPGNYCRSRVYFSLCMSSCPCFLLFCWAVPSVRVPADEPGAHRHITIANTFPLTGASLSSPWIRTTPSCAWAQLFLSVLELANLGRAGWARDLWGMEPTTDARLMHSRWCPTAYGTEAQPSTSGYRVPGGFSFTCVSSRPRVTHWYVTLEL